MKCQGGRGEAAWNSRGCLGNYPGEFELDSLDGDYRVLEGRVIWSYLHFRKIPGCNARIRVGQWQEGQVKGRLGGGGRGRAAGEIWRSASAKLLEAGREAVKAEFPFLSWGQGQGFGGQLWDRAHSRASRSGLRKKSLGISEFEEQVDHASGEEQEALEPVGSRI